MKGINVIFSELKDSKRLKNSTKFLFKAVKSLFPTRRFNFETRINSCEERMIVKEANSMKRKHDLSQQHFTKAF